MRSTREVTGAARPDEAIEMRLDEFTNGGFD
jgi:hypothetical protein